MSDPISDSTTPFGDDAHMAALAERDRRWAEAHRLLLASYAREDADRRDELRRRYEAAVIAAAASARALVIFDEREAARGGA